MPTAVKEIRVRVEVNTEHASGDEFELARDAIEVALYQFDHDPAFVRCDVFAPHDMGVPL